MVVKRRNRATTWCRLANACMDRLRVIRRSVRQFGQILMDLVGLRSQRSEVTTRPRNRRTAPLRGRGEFFVVRVRPRRDGVGLHGSGGWAQEPRPRWWDGSLWACDSLGDHASTRSRLGSLHFWIWRGSRIILRHVRDFRTYKKQLFLERGFSRVKQ
jgi:hypothetical protein